MKLSIMALAIASAGISAHAQTLTADQIFQKHVEAVGGVANWNKIKTIKLIGSMSQQGMEISMNETIVNDKAMRIDISAMGQSGYMIYTTTGGWMFMPFMGQTEPKAMTEEELKGSKDQLNYKNGQLIDKSDITKMTLDGTDTINNASCYKLKVTTKDGNDQTCYVDSKSFYLLRIEKKMKVQDDEQEVAVNYSNFVKQPEGIVIPMVIGSPQGDVTFKSVEINKPIDEKIFKPDTKSDKK